MRLRWKVILFVLGFLFISAAAVPLLHFKARRAVESYKRKLLAQGEKLTISELIPATATNGNERAKEFLENVKSLTSIERVGFPLPMKRIASGRAEVSWRSEKTFDGEKRTEIWDLLQKEVEANARATEALRVVTKGGEMIFPIDNTQGYRGSLPHLVPLRQAAVWLATATIFQLHEGNKSEAAENLKAILSMVENYKGEPSMMSQLMRATSIQIAFNTTWEALQYPDWTDRELEEIQKAWSAVKFESAERFFAVELANGIQMFEEARKSSGYATVSARGAGVSLVDDLTDFATDITTDPGAAFKALMNRPNHRLWRWVLSYDEELFALKLWQAGLEAARTMEEKGYYQPSLKKLDAHLEAKVSHHGFLLGDTRTLVRNTVVRLGSAKIARQLAITGCALNRARIRNGQYPATLKELVPQLVAAMPIDPVDGAPVRYRVNPDGSFLLYSVGENGVDEGGDSEPDAQLENRYSAANSSRRMRWSYITRGRDWVWPQPATESEIRKWEQEEMNRQK